jgi:hypothetical protein
MKESMNRHPALNNDIVSTQISVPRHSRNEVGQRGLYADQGSVNGDLDTSSAQSTQTRSSPHLSKYDVNGSITDSYDQTAQQEASSTSEDVVFQTLLQPLGRHSPRRNSTEPTFPSAKRKRSAFEIQEGVISDFITKGLMSKGHAEAAFITSVTAPIDTTNSSHVSQIF